MGFYVVSYPYSDPIVQLEVSHW